MNLPRLAAAAALSVAALTACDYTHPNGCVERVGLDHTGHELVPLTGHTPASPRVFVWVDNQLNAQAFTLQEDGRDWATPQCAQSMPTY